MNLARARLILEVQKQRLEYCRGENIWFPSGPLPIVSLELFFEGNTSNHSLGVNLDHRHPGIEVFYAQLKTIRARPDVQDVLVEVYQIEEDTELWPFSDRVYVLTSATEEEVERWVAPLCPDVIEPGYAFGAPPTAPRLRPGMQVYSIWWD